MADEQVKYTPEDLEQAKEHNGHKKGCPASRIMIAGLYCESCLHTAALIAQVRREERQKAERLAEALEFYTDWYEREYKPTCEDLATKIEQIFYQKAMAALADFRKGQAE